jgi:Sulfotransferase family
MSSLERAVANSGFVAQRQRFLDEARAVAGLDDFGSEDYGTGLDLFLSCLDRETRLSPQGLAMTVVQIQLLLASRLHSEAGWKRRPDALAQRLEAPLLITGIVRSGTTALHKLLSIDPQFQGLEHWLARAPQPRPPRQLWPSIPAYRQAAGIVETMIEHAPEMKTDHMISAEEVEESILLLPQLFTDNMFPSQWTVPGYDAWYLEQDKTPSYLRFARNLQLIGVDQPKQRWLLKNPSDLLAMDAVLQAFPDVMIVQTHRDPLQSIPSVANLLLALRRMFEGESANPATIGRRETEFWARALERAAQARARTRLPVFDLEFSDFVRDQIGAVQAIYRHFGLILEPETRTAMQDWLAANPRRSTALQRFEPEDFGVTSAALRQRFGAYRQARGYV